MSKITVPGVKVLSEHAVLMDSIDDAEDMFVLAKDRLLAVNHWRAHDAGGRFELLDKKGHPARRSAHFHDLVRITNNTDNGANFRIEHLIYDDYPDTNAELFSMELLPVTQDGSPVPGEGKLLLIIERHGSTVVCCVAKPPYADDTADAYNVPWKTLPEDLLRL